MSEGRNFINGQWVEGKESLANINPSDTSDVIGRYARADSAQVHEAVRSAKAAQPDWVAGGIQRRSDILDRAGSEILARKEELGDLLAREEGKTRPEGIAEAGRAGQIFKFFAGEALRLVGDKLDSVRPGIDVEVTREPLGVVGLITPWNFPIAIPAWKIAPALAYGNTVVIKPAELTPGCASALTEILERAGLPAGVLNLVMGRGSEIGEAIVSDSDVAAVSFTGSVSTGRNIAIKALERGAKFQLEMGGKNPLVVLDDADLDVAVNCAVNGAYFSTGHRCTASSRLIVTEQVHDRFVDQLSERVKSLKVGDARAEDTEIGPVVDDSQLNSILEYVDIGVKEGANLVCGGQRLNMDKEGYYMAPALFTETDNRMRINQEEIFGPVASVVRVRDYEEALATANDTDFGLSAGICTRSLKHARDFRRNAAAGMVMVNLPTAGVDYHVPFGGTKASSYGPREQGRYAQEFYTTVKTAYTLPL